MTDVVRVSACRLCDSPDLDLVLAFTPTPPGDQYLKEPTTQRCYPINLMACRSCGAVQLADTVDPRLIYTDYIYATSISPGLPGHFIRYAGDVVERLQAPVGAFAVDIGSNDGTLLRAFHAKGCRVLGVDPATAIADRARASGIPTVDVFFSKERARDLLDLYGAADIITANHIMANVADLHDFIDGVKTLLAPDGTFVFETGYWPSIVRNRLIDTIEHEHIHYFAVAPLAKLFARHGISLVHVEEQPTKGGSLRGYVKHAPAEQDATVADFEAVEHGVDMSSWCGGLMALREEIRRLVETKPKAERWVGFGAAVGSTLLLHHFGLGAVVQELWDDNARRHGMVSPGFHIPVTAPNSSQADRIIMLAWRYADMIVKKHQGHSGRWIVPLPHLRFL